MKNNSVSFSYQLPIYHRNTMMACLLLLLLANDCVPLLFFLSRSLILRKYNGMNESPFLLRSQGIPSVRNECHQWWRWDSHRFFLFGNDFFWVFKLLTFFSFTSIIKERFEWQHLVLLLSARRRRRRRKFYAICFLLHRISEQCHHHYYRLKNTVMM